MIIEDKNLDLFGIIKKWFIALRDWGRGNASIVKAIMTKFFVKTKYKIRYYIFQSRIFFINIWSRFFKILRFIFIIIYFVVVFAIAYYLPRLFQFSVENGELVQIYIGLGAMLAGIIAIVFSVSTFLIQNAASKFSAGFYETLAKDQWTNTINLFIGLSSFIFFIFAFLSATNLVRNNDFQVFSTTVTIIILGFIFLSLFVLLDRVKIRINPFSGLRLVRDQTIVYLNKLNKHADAVSELFSSNPDANKEDKGFFKAQVYNANKAILTEINNRLTYLFDFHDKVLNNQEKKLALKIINVITEILSNPSGIFLSFQSDSQSFLAPNLGRFVAIGIQYMEKKDDVGASHVISALGSLCFSANNIKTINRLPVGENAVLAQCQGYLNQYIEEAIKNGNTEVLYQGAKWLGSLGVLIVDKSNDTGLATTFNSLFKIASYGIVINTPLHKVVYQEALSAYTTILNKLAYARYFDTGVHTKTIFRHITALIGATFTMVTSKSLESSFDTITGLSSIFEGVQEIIFNLENRINKTADDKDKRIDKRLMFEIADNLEDTTRTMAKKIKNADHLLVGTIAKNIANICNSFISLSQEKEWVPEKSKLIEATKSLLYKPSLFVYEAVKIENTFNGFDEIVETYAKVGLMAIDKKVPELAEIAINQIHSIAVQMLSKESGSQFGYTEPRIMERACYIGIYALKKENHSLIQKLKPLVKDFEKKYVAKWFNNMPKGYKPTSTTKDQLLHEVSELKENFNEYDIGAYGREIRRQFMDRSEDVLVSMTKKEDIDKFTIEIWGVKIETKRRSII